MGLDPLEMLVEVYKESMDAYRKGRGLTEKSDSGAQYLAVAGSAANNLARYVYPQLSATKVEVNDKREEPKRLNVTEAVKVISEDPFLANALEAAKTQVIDTPVTPHLPIGKPNVD